jgi:hypothetical protein
MVARSTCAAIQLRLFVSNTRPDKPLAAAEL